MLFKIAWRNIWRNKRRSVIVIGSVVVGVVSIIFMDALTNGFVGQMLFNQISINVGHVQVHGKGFTDNKSIKNYIPDHQNIENAIKQNDKIEHYSKRVISFGLISSASSSSGIYIYGVFPELEKQVSILDQSIIEGEYLSNGQREIIIGDKIAEKLNVDIDDKVVCMANRIDGSIGSEVFRVKGIFSTPNSEFDGAYVYTNINTIQSMLDLGDKVYEYAITAKDYRLASQIDNELEAKLNDKYEIKSYKEILPLLILQVDMAKESMFVINLIIGLALIFGITNTMLMAVFERIREFGVLMSIGMKNGKIFLMILMESVITGIVGTVIGFVLGVLIVLPLASSGIDLTLFAEGLSSLGIGSVIYPVLDLQGLITTLLTIPFITVLGAIYPAYKAIKLEPVYAISYV